MTALRILHLIDRLSLGGAARSLIASARHSTAGHRVLSIRSPDARALALARDAGVEPIDAARFAEEVAACDIVHLHFWNTPELYALLRAGLPPCRLVLTSHVLGSSDPHVLVPGLLAMADHIIATSPETLTRCRLGAPAVSIPAAADFERLNGLRRAPHEGFAVGYIGTVDFAKMHPDYVAMHAAADVPAMRILVCGSGNAAPALRRQAGALGLAKRFELCGFVEDVRSVFERLDVFGYPLCEGNYATSELVLHEAMFAGLPCVVLANGGAANTIVDGETGFLVSDAAGFADRLRMLAADSALGTRIGRQAALHARASLGAANVAPMIDAVYTDTMALPPRPRRLAAATDGCDAFLRSLGPAAAMFRGSLAGDRACDDRIVRAPPVLASADAGGVLHYRRVYPDDAPLRFWAGLVLLGERRAVLAAGEFEAARKLGFDAPRAAEFLRAALAMAGASTARL